MGLMGGVSLIGCCLLMWWMTASAAAGQIERNSQMGIRTFDTQKSDAAWLAGHRGALPTVCATAIVGLVLGLTEAILGAGGLKDGASPGPIVILFAAGIVWLIAGLSWAAHRASVAARSDPGDDR